MSELAAKVACGLLAALLAVAGVMYVRALHAELETSQAAAKAAQQGIADRDDTIKNMRDIQHSVELARAKLEGERAAVRATLSDRETLIGKLQYENAEIRTWSAVSLPGDVIRLREHPAVTGAASYRAGMPSREPLHSAGGVGSQ
jgi:LysB family phage lysis regulatory protein